MAATMSGDAGQKAVMSWIRDRENARTGSKEEISKPLCPEMTPAVIKSAAVAHEGYETPELNDNLYLHFKGFRKIENLEPYVNLKALFLDSNGLSVIENLGHLSQLRCLYLQNNLIEKITGLEGLTSLVSLDLSHNRLFKLENLSVLPNLQTLNVSRNYLSTVESLQHLTACSQLATVDIGNNSIEDGAVIEEVLAQVPMLVSINMAGNPVVSQTPQFRKRVICALPKLRYLDRPVFELERITAEAWQSGGRDAEVAARHAFNQRQRDEHRAQVREGGREDEAVDRPMNVACSHHITYA
jgi:dynein assembly factor 1